MRFGPIEVKDKTGAAVILRNAETEDAEMLMRYLKAVAEETPYLLREAEEWTLNLDQEKEIINAKIEDDRELMLIALVDGKHAGNCSLMRAGHVIRNRHRCTVGIALYQEFCGRGIGRIMLDTVLGAAKRAWYEQAELEVAAGNARAIALYEKLGFERYGRFPNNMKYKDDSYTDTYWMMKRL